MIDCFTGGAHRGRESSLQPRLRRHVQHPRGGQSPLRRTDPFRRQRNLCCENFMNLTLSVWTSLLLIVLCYLRCATPK